METALAAGQQQEFVRAVHSIKGASANFGADDLHMTSAPRSRAWAAPAA